MRTKTVNVYTYPELSESAKDKVKQWYNSDIQDLTETLNYDLHEIWAFPNAKLSYSLSNCQGDGVSFTGTWEGDELKAILENAYDFIVPYELTSLLPRLTLKLISIDHYSHVYTVNTELLLDGYSWDCDEEHDKLIEAAQKTIDQWRITVCKALEDTGYAEIADRNSDDFMINACEANGYEFYENGELA